MGYTITFEDYTPPPKADGVVWAEVHVDESSVSTGPWIEIDVIGLNPRDTDPMEPMARTFTTTKAGLPTGWYQVRWEDLYANQSAPTPAIQNVPDETLAYQPTLSDIAALMHARTLDTLGNEGAFNSSTRPTSQQVLDLIQQSADDVMAGFDVDIPAGAYRYAKQAIIYRTAMLVELGYWPEQINTGRSPYPQYEAMFTAFMTNLAAAISREQTEELLGDTDLPPGYARYTFPSTDRLVGWDTVW